MERTGNFIDNSAKVLALLLPVSQFFLRYLPDSLKSIFVAPNFFLPVSILVLLVCGAIWLVLLGHPYFQIPFNPTKHRNYQDKLNKYQAKINGLPESGAKPKGVPPSETEKPFYLVPDNIQIIALMIAIAFGLIFLSIGITAGPHVAHALQFLQCTSYIFMIAMFFVVLMAYSESRKNVSNYNSTEAMRYQNAINQAIEGRAFAGFPTVRYIGMEQLQNPTPANPASHVIYVAVDTAAGSAQYRIATNYYGKVIYWVLPESAISGSGS